MAYYGKSALYRQCAARGLTKAQTAKECGVSRSAVTRFAGRNPDVKFAKHVPPNAKDQRVKVSMKQLNATVKKSNFIGQSAR